MAREMTRTERKRQRELVLQSMLLAETRAERHEVDARRLRKARRAAWTMPTVNERQL